MLLFLAGDVIPLPTRPDPDAVLVAEQIVWFSAPPGGELDSGAIQPLLPIKEVRQPNPSPC